LDDLDDLDQLELFLFSPRWPVTSKAGFFLPIFLVAKFFPSVSPRLRRGTSGAP
jgi:hypothetical protein